MDTHSCQESEECKFCSDGVMNELDIDTCLRSAFRQYCEYFHHHDSKPDMEQFEECYRGNFDTVGEFCEHLYESCDDSYNNLTDTLKKNIDWQQVWEYAIQYDYLYEHGHVFHLG